MFSTEQSPAISRIAPPFASILGFQQQQGIRLWKTCLTGRLNGTPICSCQNAGGKLFTGVYTPRGCHTISMGFTDPVPEK
jgi:hypothetical protein